MSSAAVVDAAVAGGAAFRSGLVSNTHDNRRLGRFTKGSQAVESSILVFTVCPRINTFDTWLAAFCWRMFACLLILSRVVVLSAARAVKKVPVGDNKPWLMKVTTPLVTRLD